MIDALQSPSTLIGSADAVGGTSLATTRGVTPAGNSETAGADFSATMMQLADDAASAVRNAEALSIAGIQGRASVQQVVEAVMNAEQTLTGAVAIRDKVVAAYLELSRMQI